LRATGRATTLVRAISRNAMVVIGHACGIGENAIIRDAVIDA